MSPPTVIRKQLSLYETDSFVRVDHDGEMGRVESLVSSLLIL